MIDDKHHKYQMLFFTLNNEFVQEKVKYKFKVFILICSISTRIQTDII